MGGEGCEGALWPDVLCTDSPTFRGHAEEQCTREKRRKVLCSDWNAFVYCQNVNIMVVCKRGAF